ncbi:MAG: Bax inhibitor-1/YccA family protein [Rhodothermales bacterium]|nr:Bax inhibitor-1/YccA family protein [Rhodothermales bacterium]
MADNPYYQSAYGYAETHPAYAGARAAVDLRPLFTRAFGWMAVGLLLSAAAAALVLNVPALQQLVLGNRLVFFGLMIAELAVVWILSARIHRMSVPAATLGFLGYAAMNGLTLSVFAFAYTTASIASVFVITSLTFAFMALWGATTKRDLSSWGSILIMALIGVIVAMIVNLFMNSSVLGWIISIVGVLVFVGLTAYDVQKLKTMAADVDGEVTLGRLGILGALTLYLDFVNLFLFLLRILGGRRD